MAKSVIIQNPNQLKKKKKFPFKKVILQLNQPIYQLQWTPPPKKRSDPNNTLTLTTLITHQSSSKDKPIKSIPTHTIPKERNKEKTRTPT